MRFMCHKKNTTSFYLGPNKTLTNGTYWWLSRNRKKKSLRKQESFCWQVIHCYLATRLFPHIRQFGSVWYFLCYDYLPWLLWVWFFFTFFFLLSMGCENYPGLHWFLPKGALWLVQNTPPISQPIRCKTKTNHDFFSSALRGVIPFFWLAVAITLVLV